MGMLDKIKKEINRSSSSFSDEFYLKDGDKAKIRFLTDFEEPVKVRWHDNWDEKIDTPCLEYYGRDCPYCKADADVRTRDNFVWVVYNYDEEKVQLFRWAANSYTPVPQLLSMYESYGTLLDRDFQISRSGTSFDISYQVVPMDKGDFDKDVDVYSKKEIFDLLASIHNVSFEAEDDDEAETVTELDEEDMDGMNVPWEDEE